MPAKHAKPRQVKSKTRPVRQMAAAELEALTADLDEEFVMRKFGPPPPDALAKWQQAKRKLGRPLRHA